jgi:hypothetical protein
MVIPPHDIIIGMPMFIIAIIRWQHSMNISFVESSIGIISHFLPAGVMVQVILHIIIGIMPPIMPIGVMPPIGIIPAIIGIIPLIIGIIPLIMGMFIGIVVAAAVMVGSVGSLGRSVTMDLQGADQPEQQEMHGAAHFGLIE